MKQDLFLVKIGGNVLDDPDLLKQVINTVASVPGKLIMVHGGGRELDQWSARAGIIPQKVNGRRLTDAETLKLALMVYGGLLNKQLVAELNAAGSCAIGLTGADADSIRATRRSSSEIDWGFVGDVQPGGVNADLISCLLERGMIPVFCAITHDNEGRLFNTNADTMAAEIAVAMSAEFRVTLLYCFEKHGVLMDAGDDASVIPVLDQAGFGQLKEAGIARDGMIPKLDNAFGAIGRGVESVRILHASALNDALNGNTVSGTLLVNDMNGLEPC